MKKSILIVFAALLLLVSHAIAALPNYTPITHIDNTAGTPFTIWFSMGLVGFLLFLYSLPPKTSTAELEHSVVVSVIAWFPIGFTAYTSWAVSSIVVIAEATSGVLTITEDHIIQHFDIIGVAYGVFFIVAIINTIRLLALHKSLRLQREQQE